MTDSRYAAVASEKLNAYIDAGQAAAPVALQRLAAMQPTDTVAPASRVGFTDFLDMILDKHEERRVHENALKQAATRVEIPPKYVTALLSSGEWGKRLLAENLREQFAHSNERVLIRSVGDEVRALFSDKYRRLDAWPILNSFVEEAANAGAVVTEANVTDLRAGIKVIRPEIIYVNGDPVVLGARLGLSDFIASSVQVSTFLFRLLCGNGMIGEQALRQVHIGRRIGDDATWSERTRSLDSQTMASAVGDVARAQLSDEAVKTKKERIERAAGTEIDVKASLKELGKVLTKGELDTVTETFMFGNAEQVPDGKNAWRLGNALSWIAKSATNAERGMDLERMAGAVIDSATTVVSAKLLDDILTTHDLMTEAARRAA